jgi:phage terminase Nu1 subunit (DNA packaging protein)
VAEKKSKRWRVGNLAEVAEFFGVSPETVRHWRGAGMPGQAKGWELDQIARWRVARAGRERKRPSGNGEQAEDPRDVEKHWKAQLAKLEYETKTGQRIGRAEHERQLGEWCGWFRQVLGLLGAQLAPLLAHQPARNCRRIIDRQARKILRAAFGERPKPPRRQERQGRLKG